MNALLSKISWSHVSILFVLTLIIGINVETTQTLTFKIQQTIHDLNKQNCKMVKPYWYRAIVYRSFQFVLAIDRTMHCSTKTYSRIYDWLCTQISNRFVFQCFSNYLLFKKSNANTNWCIVRTIIGLHYSTILYYSIEFFHFFMHFIDFIKWVKITSNLKLELMFITWSQTVNKSLFYY